MVSLYKYFSELLAGDSAIKGVYESMGEGEISRLSASIRDLQYPCVVCEIGDDGEINLTDLNCDKTVQLFYVLESVSARSAEDWGAALCRAKRKGFELLSHMRHNSDFGSALYGVDLSSVKYFKVAPIKGAVGYCFTLSFIDAQL